ncbi:MBT domain-containing protein 1 [Orchesella cincta]|uniref:MBT domain-containing protein 1 n=1 Tax=Orchesella cincta TaxID=48709 RepID=A0A1D2NM53_ORCCI|nr:MBT domain-containing protein 1 [Orchesella cincta]
MAEAEVKRRTRGKGLPVSPSGTAPTTDDEDIGNKSSTRPRRGSSSTVGVGNKNLGMESSVRQRRRSLSTADADKADKTGKSKTPTLTVETSVRLVRAGRSRNRQGKVKRRKGESNAEADDDEDGPFTLFRQSDKASDWDVYLKDLDAISWVAPVDFFKNAPFATRWKQIAKVGMQIELPHPKVISSKCYCVGTIVAFAGYKAMVRLENLNPRSYKSIVWISFCSSIPKHLGYSFRNRKVLLPNDAPDHITDDKKDEDFIRINEEFVEQIYGKSDLQNTVSQRHSEIVLEELEEKQSQFSLNEVVEVMDKEEPVRNRLARIVSVTGDRIIVRYVDADENDQGFCFNMNSELVHPLGWSHCVGQNLKACPKSMYTFKSLSKNSFPKYPSDLKIKVDMVFELRHPCIPYKVVTASVYKKLHFGYFVAKIDSNDPDDAGTFVFHVTSDYILPCGFCKEHNIPLEVPSGEDDSCFNWHTYCKVNDLTPLGLEKVYPKPAHKFVKGSKLEAVDICQPLYLGPATVVNTADHLLYLHFDGWPNKDEYYQWISAFSPDIYPAGWAEMVGHSFQSHAKPPNDVDHYYIPKQK